MTDDFSGSMGDALLGLPGTDDSSPELPLVDEARHEQLAPPEAGLLESVPGPAPKLWDEIERQLRREGVIK
jgi:hypothetical protein